MRSLAGLFWLLCGFAVLEHLHGNPTAINGVIGAGIVALAFTALALVERR